VAHIIPFSPNSVVTFFFSLMFFQHCYCTLILDCLFLTLISSYGILILMLKFFCAHSHCYYDVLFFIYVFSTLLQHINYCFILIEFNAIFFSLVGFKTILFLVSFSLFFVVFMVVLFVFKFV